MIRITVFSFFLVLCSWAFAQSPAYRQTLPNSTVSALTAPADMVIDSRNHVFVIDKKKNAIVHFDALGNEIEVIAEVQTTRGAFKLKKPVCLANHPQGIMIYDADQQHIFLHGPNKGAVWGTPGGEKGQLEDVIDMATDSQGFLYVLQRKRNCIEVFNASGDFVTWIAPSKVSFQKAFAIEVSLSDELYVLDQEIHSLFIYNIAF
jgi:6-phosphogluconolactonase (cycloisomerase 2 family)